jgi:ankyrin repeat protein
VAAGVDVNATQEGGYTALQAAVQHDDEAMAALLRAAGATPA